MVDEKRVRVDEMSFIVHLWLEDREHPAWRGRVTDSNGEHSSAFEDGQSLLGFIQSRLREISDIALPARRNPS